MGERLLSRRTFAKLAAATGAALAITPTATALAETKPESTPASDVKRIRTCCRGCGKMECGVWVTVENGRAVKIEGDTSNFASGGNCCAKSQSSVQAAYHPDRILYPMKRTNPKDAEDPGWTRITWDEAYSTMAQKFQEIIDRYGGPSIMMMSGTSRCWCMGSYGVFRVLFGSPNSVHPYQVCKGPRHFATMLNSAYGFSWQATVDHPRVMVRWGGSTEMSNYDDSCRITVDTAKHADHFITVDPRLTNLGRESTIWQPLYPQTDAALALSWMNVIIENDLIDLPFVKKWTNAPFLVVEDMEPTPGPMGAKFQVGYFQTMTRLLCESDLKADGSPFRLMCWDTIEDRYTYYDASTGEWEGQTYTMPMKGKPGKQDFYPGVSPGFVPDTTGFGVEDGFAKPIDPAMTGTFEVTLKDGSVHKARTVWDAFVERCAEFTPEKAEKITHVPADQIELAAKTYATRLDPETGYGNGGIGYMLAIEHGCNAIQNSRALDCLVGITGNWDTPGGNRGGTTSFLTPQQVNFGGNVCMGNLGSNITSMPEDVINMAAGYDEFPVLKWWQYWADANACYEQIATGDPYPIKGGIAQSGDFMNMGNSLYNFEAMQNLDFLVVSDFWHTPLADIADIIVPCAHWLEVPAARPSQGSSGALGFNVPCIETPGEAKYDVVFDIELFKAMGVPFNSDPANPWPTLEEYCDWYIARTGMTWKEMTDEFQEKGWYDCKAMPPEWQSTWGFYRRYEMGMLRPDLLPGFMTPTGKLELWNTTLETFYAEDPTDILPNYRPAPLGREAAPELAEELPFICNTGRRIPVYFHSEHRQLPWCREQWPVPRVEINPADAAEYGIEQGDWVWIENENGKIRQCADLYEGIERGVINCEHQWWYPELDQKGHGFELSGVNCLVYRNHRDRHCASSYLRGYPVKIYKATPENSPFNNPIPCGNDGKPIIHDASDPRLKEWANLVYEGVE